MKIVKILLAVFGIIIALTLAAVIYVAASVWDSTDNTSAEIKGSDITIERFIHREAVKALSAEGDDVNVLLDERAMNELLYAVVKGLKVPMVDVIGANVKYAENGALAVEIPLKAAGFVPTCIKARVRITYVDRVLSVTIESASVGNFDCTSFFIRTFFLNSANGKNWQKELDKAGIKCTLDIDKLTVKMTSAEIIETISKFTENDPNSLLYTLVTDLALNSEQMLGFSFGEDGYYGVRLHSARIKYDQTTDGEIDYPLDLDSASASTAALSDNGLKEKNVSAVFHYYVSGYESLSDGEKKLVDELGLSKTETGVRTVAPSTMADVVASQSASFEATLINHDVTVTVTESQMNAILACLDVIGMGTAFVSENKVAYVTLEAVNVELFDNNMKLVVIVNLNGRRLCGYLDADCPESDRLSVAADVNVLRLGKEVMNEFRLKTFLKYLDLLLKKEEWIYTVPEDGTVYLDMQSTIENSNRYVTVFSKYSATHLQLRRTSDGQLQLVFKKN